MSTADERIAELEAQVCALRVNNDALRAQVQELVAQNQQLQARFAKDSHNSSKPPPERPPGRKGRLKQSPARNLLERLWMGQHRVLAFLDDLTIPFDNNRAEQDLRMLKVQQKIAGSFRADTGSEAFARIRGYCTTLRKQGVALFGALQTVFSGQLLYPDLG
jgi:uncharacterized coiled-coil protein SlyX